MVNGSKQMFVLSCHTLLPFTFIFKATCLFSLPVVPQIGALDHSCTQRVKSEMDLSWTSMLMHPAIGEVLSFSSQPRPGYFSPPAHLRGTVNPSLVPLCIFQQ